MAGNEAFIRTCKTQPRSVELRGRWHRNPSDGQGVGLNQDLRLRAEFRGQVDGQETVVRHDEELSCGVSGARNREVLGLSINVAQTSLN